MATSKSGTWLDTESGKIVHSAPVNGRLLVNEGEEITPAVQATIDQFAEDHAENTPPDISVQPEVEPVKKAASKKV